MKFSFKTKKVEKSEVELLWERLISLEPTRHELELIIEKVPALAETAFALWVAEATIEELSGVLRSKNTTISSRASMILLERSGDDKDILMNIIRKSSDDEAEVAWNLFIAIADNDDLIKVVSDYNYGIFSRRAAEILFSRATGAKELRWAMQSQEHRDMAWERVKLVATAEDLAWVATHIEEHRSEAIDLLLQQKVSDAQLLIGVARATDSEKEIERIWAVMPTLTLEELEKAVDQVYGDQPIIARVWQTIQGMNLSDEKLFRIVWNSFRLKELAWNEVKARPDLDPHELAFVIDRQRDPIRDEAWKLLKKQPMSSEKAPAIISVVQSCGYGEKLDGLEEETYRALSYELGAESYQQVIERTKDDKVKKLAGQRLLTTKKGILWELFEKHGKQPA